MTGLGMTRILWIRNFLHFISPNIWAKFTQLTYYYDNQIYVKFKVLVFFGYQRHLSTQNAPSTRLTILGKFSERQVEAGVVQGEALLWLLGLCTVLIGLGQEDGGGEAAKQPGALHGWNSRPTLGYICQYIKFQFAVNKVEMEGFQGRALAIRRSGIFRRPCCSSWRK